MSRKVGSQTRLSYAASITLGQAKVILSLYWRQCLAGAVLLSFVSVALSFSEPPRFQSVGQVRIKTFDINRSNKAEMLRGGDEASGKELVDRQLRLMETPDFKKELHRLTMADPERNKLQLIWGIGERLKFSFFLKRTGLGASSIPKVELSGLTDEELAALFFSISQAQPNYASSGIDIKAVSIDRFTAEKAAEIMARALVSTARIVEEKELSSSLTYLRTQRDQLRARMVDAEDSLKQFYKENPALADDTTKNSVRMEANLLQEELKRKGDELLANQRLLEFYKKKFTTFLKSADTTTEVFDKFKQELVELKYQKKKFIFQGYSPDHEGILEIDRKIANVEKVLSSAGDISDRNVVSVGHESQLSSKIVNLQDQIKKQEIDLETIRKRKAEAEARSQVLPAQEMLHAEFQREVKLSRDLFEDISRRVELAEIRISNLSGTLTGGGPPSAAVLVRNLPTGKRLFFSFLMGFLISGALCVATAVLRRKVIDELSVADMGFKFAGHLMPSNSDRAKVLLNLGCSYGSDSQKASIVLCSSPRGSFSVKQVLMLTEYLARQKERSLFIVIGSLDIKDHFQLKSDLGYAKVFNSRDGNQFLLQIIDEDTIHSIRECIAITERHYRVRYSMIFLFIQKGSECLVYPYGQKLADKMLLVGPSAECSSWEYYRLVDGFENLDEVYVALTDAKGQKSRIRQESRAWV